MKIENPTPAKCTSPLELPSTAVMRVFAALSSSADPCRRSISAVFGPQHWDGTEGSLSIPSGLSSDVFLSSSSYHFFPPIENK